MRFFSDLIANFYHLMLVINSIKIKDLDLTKFISLNCIRYEFFDTNYLKCSNNFAADCRCEDIGCPRKRTSENIQNGKAKFVLEKAQLTAQCNAGTCPNIFECTVQLILLDMGQRSRLPTRVLLLIKRLRQLRP